MTYSMRSPPNPNFSNPHASTRVQKPRLVIEKGRLVKLHKVEKLPLRSFTVSTGLFLYFHNQRHLSIKSRGNAYSHILKELFLGFGAGVEVWKFRRGKINGSHVNGYMMMEGWSGRGWPKLI
ncbi:hypothetical protein OIU79_010447 [Salix purpurea]|uniref:Uncharacterized protein n=1 Tax=Salix purpurea TaxID=77065 RepID=A0A9Q0QFM5_SALPP|nr:hypothetical protein OIU79_010447 [Salix purpurea]